MVLRKCPFPHSATFTDHDVHALARVQSPRATWDDVRAEKLIALYVKLCQ